MTYTRINIMMPTRKRLPWLQRMLESAYATAAHPDSLVATVLLDSDDPQRKETERFLSAIRPAPSVRLNTSSDGPHLARFFNALYDTPPYNTPDTLVSMVGDDAIFESRGWDAAVLDAMNAAKGWALVYGDDCYVQHERMCVHFFTSRLLVEATGHPFMWERWRANIIDVVWYHVAKRLGALVYLPEVHIRHDHSGQYQDETYRRMNPVRQFANGKHWPKIKAYIDKVVSSTRRGQYEGN